ncbi:hypothetical protein BaRGS_00014187, partial [Batillaria attramentaria]
MGNPNTFSAVRTPIISLVEDLFTDRHTRTAGGTVSVGNELYRGRLEKKKNVLTRA